jgi:hypothetical protein
MVCVQQLPQVVECTPLSSFNGRFLSLPFLRCHELWLAVTANMNIYEGSSKCFHTFIFSWETVKTGGAVIGRV